MEQPRYYGPICASYGVLPFDFKPTHLVGDPLLQHLNTLEQEAEDQVGQWPAV